MILDNNTNYLGESPIWNYFNNTLYWVDIDNYKIKSYNDQSETLVFETEKKPTSLSLIDNNKIFVSMEDSLGIYDFRINKYNMLYKLNNPKVRFNDAKCDRNGILHIGTMCLQEPKLQIGSIYKYQSNSLVELINNIGIANGISFSKNNEIMYYSDSSINSLYNSKINNNTLFDNNNNYTYDGSTVDINDNYYSCLWNGYGINIYDKFQKKKYIKLPCKYTTCCCFGGIDMNKIFITSAFNNNTDNGKLYMINSDIEGIKESPICL